VIFYLTFWYKKNEQALRVAMFVSSVSMAGAFGGSKICRVFADVQ
jgi:hypothetical protein